MDVANHYIILSGVLINHCNTADIKHEWKVVWCSIWEQKAFLELHWCKLYMKLGDNFGSGFSNRVLNARQSVIIDSAGSPVLLIYTFLVFRFWLIGLKSQWAYLIINHKLCTICLWTHSDGAHGGRYTLPLPTPTHPYPYLPPPTLPLPTPTHPYPYPPLPLPTPTPTYPHPPYPYLPLPTPTSTHPYYK